MLQSLYSSFFNEAKPHGMNPAMAFPSVQCNEKAIYHPIGEGGEARTKKKD